MKNQTFSVEDVVRLTEQHFGERVLAVTAPGGRKRRSLRVHFARRTIIATFRPQSAATRHEQSVVAQIGQHCDDVPRILGHNGGVLFQSDVGASRLGQAIQTADAANREVLARQAITTILNIHRAARQTDLDQTAPHLGASAEWVANLVAGIDRLASRAGLPPVAFDRDAAQARLTQPPRQFVKWDCRSGNAALDGSGRLRWFDFEYSGLRHGAEDIAWLIADEIWPVSADRMLQIVAETHQPHDAETTAAYLDYLHLYSVFHAIQRILLIAEQARRRGWRSRAIVVKRDDVGLTPHIAIAITDRAADLARSHPLTRPFEPTLRAVEDLFRRVLDEAAEASNASGR